jgi:hypothetical protein
MKSAYELAMERLAASDPETSTPLTAEDKTELAQIDARFKAKLAEREIFLKQKLAEAHASNDYQAVQDIERQMTSERASIEEDREAEKDRIRNRRR